MHIIIFDVLSLFLYFHVRAVSYEHVDIRSRTVGRYKSIARHENRFDYNMLRLLHDNIIRVQRVRTNKIVLIERGFRLVLLILYNNIVCTLYTRM